MTTFYVCINNEGYEASLERRKIYSALEDAPARRRGQLRIIDESGEDYLYPAKRFETLRLTTDSRLATALRDDFSLAA
jgi:hypothetical protein